MRFRLGLVLCIAGAAAVSSHGWPQSQTPSPSSVASQDSANISQIRRLLEVMGVTKQAQTAVAAIADRARADRSLTIPPQTKQFLALFQERVNSKMQTLDVISLYVPIYDKHYTLDEINFLIAFYETPAGQKTLELQPLIAAETMQTMNPVVQKIMDESDAEIRKEHPELVVKKPSGPAPDTNVSNDHPVQRIRRGGDIVMASATHRVPPQYPESARQQHIQGTVRVQTLIGKDGTVIRAEYVSGPPELAQPSIDAVKQWRFKPTTLNGELAEVECFFDLNFSLGQ
jgi:TonB family protein